MSHTPETVAEMFMLWKAAEKAFIQHLIQRLVSDLPDFNHEKLVLGLQFLQEEWPIDRNDVASEAQGLVSLGFLGELVEVTENAIRIATNAN